MAWIEQLYAQVESSGLSADPWAGPEPNPNLVYCLDQGEVDGTGKSALVAGCGLGDDAEALTGGASK